MGAKINEEDLKKSLVFSYEPDHRIVIAPTSIGNAEKGVRLTTKD
jgi:hypothetical protein